MRRNGEIHTIRSSQFTDDPMDYDDLSAAILATSSDANATKVLLFYLLTFFQSEDSGFLRAFVEHCDVSMAFAQATRLVRPSAELAGLVTKLRMAM